LLCLTFDLFLVAETNSASEAMNLANRLQNIGSGLVGIRNTLKENGIKDPVVERKEPDLIRSHNGSNNSPPQQNYCNVDNNGARIVGMGKF
jgi:hypothetical protein